MSFPGSGGLPLHSRDDGSRGSIRSAPPTSSWWRSHDGGRGQRRKARGRAVRRGGGAARSPRRRHDHAVLARCALRGARSRRTPRRALRPARLRRVDHRRSRGSPYTLRDLAADAAALAGELDDRPAHLAGIGVGGMVAQVAALDHPDAFSALTLAGTRPVAPGPPDDDLPDHDAATMDRLFSRPLPDWSDRAAVAEFAAAGAEIRGDDPAAARATAERIWDRTPSTQPAVQMANQMGMVFSKLHCQPPWRKRLGSSRSRRSWCTAAAIRSSLSATAKRSQTRSPMHACSYSNRPPPHFPTRPPARSPRRCSNSRSERVAATGPRAQCQGEAGGYGRPRETVPDRPAPTR